MKLSGQLKRLIPAPLRALLRPLVSSVASPGYELELGEFVLSEAKVFSEKCAGMPGALSASSLRECIYDRKYIGHMSTAHQYLQTAFMPDYENNLFEYYRQQQFLILMAFLSYPFRGAGCLRPNVEPYKDASATLPKIHVLDYGAGIPFGLIHLLRTNSSQFASITIVDLDIIHAEFVEFIIRRLAPHAEVKCYRLDDAGAIPDLSKKSFNLIYAKDIFEHVLDPERLIRTMLDSAANTCVIYFDIHDHGEKYLQHVHPQLSHLSAIPKEYGFKPQNPVFGLSKFVRDEE